MSRLLAFIAVLAAAPAHAEPAERPLVVVLGDPADPITRRLDAELRATGFAVQILPSTEETGTAELREVARKAGAIASIRVRPSKTGVEIWIFDRVTGKAALREVSLEQGADPELVTIRAVELLRASLLEVHAPHPSRGEVTAPTPVVVWTRPQSPSPNRAQLRAAVGVGAHGSPGAWGFAPAMFASLQWWPHARLGIAAGTFVPFASTTLRENEGSSRLSATAATLDLRTPLELGPIVIRPGLGAAFTWLSAAGDGSTGYRGVTERTTRASAFATLDLSVPLAPRLAVVGGFWAGWSFRDAPVRFAGREVALWGRPWLASAVSLEIAWP
ncbi:MAG: hypothetical protein HYV09_24595 [Deltaproteobacteria bacterium]|nr:hypothetical protein [Deltaproteobacteria bacterium]